MKAARISRVLSIIICTIHSSEHVFEAVDGDASISILIYVQQCANGKLIRTFQTPATRGRRRINGIFQSIERERIVLLSCESLTPRRQAAKLTVSDANLRRSLFKEFAVSCENGKLKQFITITQ